MRKHLTSHTTALPPATSRERAVWSIWSWSLFKSDLFDSDKLNQNPTLAELFRDKKNKGTAYK